MKVSRCRVFSGIGLTVALVLGGVSDTSATPGSSWPRAPTIDRVPVGVWTAEWWNWVAFFPASETPLLGEGAVDCSLGQNPGRVWFLAGTPGGEVVRECTIPEDTYLFFPLINAAFTPPDCETIAECRETAAGVIDGISDVFCTVNGVPCTVSGSEERVQSPPFHLEIPEGSVFTEPEFGGNAPGDYFPAISDGIWVLLPPLDAGEHVIHFGGVVVVGDPPSEVEVDVDVTYSIVVQ
jgi:hypothetical protein